MAIGSETAVALAVQQPPLTLAQSESNKDETLDPGIADPHEQAIVSDGEGSSSLSELGDRLADQDDSDDDDTGYADVQDDDARDNDASVDEADSEAETERLHVSPQKPRTGATTKSSLRNHTEYGAAVDEPTENKSTDHRSMEADTKDAVSKSMIAGLVSGTKRKRFSGRDTELEEEPERKRAISSRLSSKHGRSLRRSRSGDSNAGVEVDAEAEANDDDMLSSDEDPISSNHKTRAKPAVDKTGDHTKDDPTSPEKDDELEDDPEEPEDDLATPEVLADDADDLANLDEDADGDGDEADQHTKNEDELALKKKFAMEALKPIENFFAILKDQLFNERDAAYAAEIETLKDASSTHQDYLAMRQCISARRDAKIEHEHIALHYKSKDLETRTLADRTQIHSQFAQKIRALRAQYVEDLNEKFCQITTERRQWKSQDPQYMFKLNPRRTVQVQHQRAYNKEVSLLSGIARHVGFPAAPAFPTLKHADIEDDLRAMKIRHRPTSYSAHIVNSSRADEAAAEEQFIEKTPWANPNHPAHQNALMLEPGYAPQPYRHPSLTTPSHPRWIADLHHKPNGAEASNNMIDTPPEPPSSAATGLGIGLSRSFSKGNDATNGSPYNRSFSKLEDMQKSRSHNAIHDDLATKQPNNQSPSYHAAQPSGSYAYYPHSDPYSNGPSNSRYGPLSMSRQESISVKDFSEQAPTDFESERHQDRFHLYNTGPPSSPIANGATAPIRTIGGVS